MGISTIPISCPFFCGLNIRYVIWSKNNNRDVFSHMTKIMICSDPQILKLTRTQLKKTGWYTCNKSDNAVKLIHVSYSTDDDK